jgi:hypothetical protein
VHGVERAELLGDEVGGRVAVRAHDDGARRTHAPGGDQGAVALESDVGHAASGVRVPRDANGFRLPLPIGLADERPQSVADLVEQPEAAVRPGGEPPRDPGSDRLRRAPVLRRGARRAAQDRQVLPVVRQPDRHDHAMGLRRDEHVAARVHRRGGIKLPERPPIAADRPAPGNHVVGLAVEVAPRRRCVALVVDSHRRRGDVERGAEPGGGEPPRLVGRRQRHRGRQSARQENQRDQQATRYGGLTGAH